MAGWTALHSKFGSLDFELLFDDAISYAENGFPLTELIAYYLNRSSEVFEDYPNFKNIWMPRGKTPIKGEIFKNKLLANDYRLIAKSYGKEFYQGKIAKNIVESVNSQGGYFTLSDLSEYEPEWIDPVSSNYRGYDVWELPPNGQGIAALQILNILENYDIKELGFYSAEYIHVFTEAKKLAFEDRAKYYADMSFAEVPVNYLISKEYAKERNNFISFDKVLKSVDSNKLEDGDTIYLTVADKFGNMVSLIQSNYRGMGSGIIPNNSGFMLQDRGEMFNLDPSHRNSLVGGKRPFHTIIPAFITKDGDPFVSFGVMGGAMQPLGHAQIVINLIDFDMNLQEAGDAPRFRHVGSSQPTGEKMTDGGYLIFENGFDPKEINKIKEIGHKVVNENEDNYMKGAFGGYQAIMKKNNVLYGASESRKDGHASGY